MAGYLELDYRMKTIRKDYSNKESFYLRNIFYLRNFYLRNILERAIRHDKITYEETYTE